MITNTALLKLSVQRNIIYTGIRMFALCKLFFRAEKLKKQDEGIVNYIQGSIKTGDTVLDIGPGKSHYIYFMRWKLKKSGKIIAFESQLHRYQHLLQLKKIMNWKNVEAEYIKLSNSTGTAPVLYTQDFKPGNGAVIINFNDQFKRSVTNTIRVQTLDDYCTTKNIKPRFLKIDAMGNELRILLGAINTLKIYKPAILLKCEERIAGAEAVLETFKILKQLGYSGYFVLDLLRIPLTNFDFNVYQNPCKNFYCGDFMFE